MNDMVNKGEIIQIKDKFRMPYGDNKNTISSCSQILHSDYARDIYAKKKKHEQSQQREGESNGSSVSSISFADSGLVRATTDGYIS